MDRNDSWVSLRAVELALAVVGVGATGASLLGVSGPVVVAGAAGTLLLAALAATLARSVGDRIARVHLNSAFEGRGYIKAFSQAERSLMLIHIDDDSPSEELLALYRAQLARGIEIRRLVFVREDHKSDGVEWIKRFGNHPSLRQRLVRLALGAPLMMSFAVVDEAIVLLAVPGFLPVETEAYSDGVVLRHLIELRHPAVTRAFLEVYESAWRRAGVLQLG